MKIWLLLIITSGHTGVRTLTTEVLHFLQSFLRQKIPFRKKDLQDSKCRFVATNCCLTCIQSPTEISKLYNYSTLGAVVVVKWSACSPSNRRSEFESRWSLQFFCKIVFEKYENKQKEAGVGPLKNLLIGRLYFISEISAYYVGKVWPKMFCKIGPMSREGERARKDSSVMQIVY